MGIDIIEEEEFTELAEQFRGDVISWWTDFL